MNEGRLANMGARLKRSGDDDDELVTFLCVPADAAKSIEELVLVQKEKSNIENFLENYISLQLGESVDLELIQQQANAARQCTTGLCPHVSPLTLQRAAEEGTLQRIKVKHIDNDDDALYLYYDESANLKRRPPNARAWTYAANPHEDTLYGDVFVVRIQHRQPVSLDKITFLKIVDAP